MNIITQALGLPVFSSLGSPMKRMIFAAAACAASLFAGASAAVTITVSEVGSDVTIAAEGTLDLTGALLLAMNEGPAPGGTSSGFGFVAAGFGAFDAYLLTTPLGTFGDAGLTTPAGVNTGPLFGIGGQGGFAALVPAGSPIDVLLVINALSAIQNASFASLGITAMGERTASLPNDTITVVFENAAPVPVPGALPLMLAALGGGALFRRRSAVMGH